MIDDLIGGQGDEIAKHDLHNRAQAAQSHPRSHADDPGLGDGRGPHPFGESFGEAARHLERPAIGVEQVFAEEDNALIGGASGVEGGVEGGEDGTCGRRTTDGGRRSEVYCLRSAVCGR